MENAAGRKDRGWQGADPGRRDDSEKLEEQMELRRDTLKENGKSWRNNRKSCNGNIMRRRKRKSVWKNTKKEMRLQSICKYGKPADGRKNSSRTI